LSWLIFIGLSALEGYAPFADSHVLRFVDSLNGEDITLLDVAKVDGRLL
jgi:hypothetical protein